jgi:hypothetical protein
MFSFEPIFFATWMKKLLNVVATSVWWLIILLLVFTSICTSIADTGRFW